MRKAAVQVAENVRVITPTTIVQFVTAAGEKLNKIVDYVTAPIQVGDRAIEHNFVVVDNLITAVILGVEFMQKHGLVLNFSHSPVQVLYNSNNEKWDSFCCSACAQAL